MTREPIVARLAGVVLVLTLPVACGSSSGPTSAPVASLPASGSASPSAPPLPAGLVADIFYTFQQPRKPGVADSSDNVMFIDSHRATLHGWGSAHHDQLSIVGNEMTFSQALPDGHPCDTADVGVYRFTVNGKVLRFQAIKDTCSQRTATLAGHDLTLSSP